MLCTLSTPTLILGAACASIALPHHVGAQTVQVEGAWAASRYVLEAGAEHRVEGRIFFTETDWQVLFFVVDESGVPRRASAEGGTYTLAGNTLTFVHLHNFSHGEEMAGLDAAPMSMEFRDSNGAPREPTTVAIEDGTLTLSFPSGNHMIFTRSSR